MITASTARNGLIALALVVLVVLGTAMGLPPRGELRNAGANPGLFFVDFRDI